MNGVFKENDKLHSVWVGEDAAGATVGFDGVTEISVGKADGPMGHYAVAIVCRGDSVWQILPLHMMSEIVVSTVE